MYKIKRVVHCWHWYLLCFSVDIVEERLMQNRGFFVIQLAICSNSGPPMFCNYSKIYIYGNIDSSKNFVHHVKDSHAGYVVGTYMLFCWTFKVNLFWKLFFHLKCFYEKVFSENSSLCLKKVWKVLAEKSYLFNF